MDDQHLSGAFPSTAWTTIQKADLHGDADGLAAMDRFVKTYWRPIYRFIRSKGYSADRAEDLTQEFLMRLMERDWLGCADKERGRFRNLVLRILVRFLSDQGPRRAPRQKQFERGITPISQLVLEEDRCFEKVAAETPEELFTRCWADSVIRGVLELLRLSYEANDMHEQFRVFESTLLKEHTAARQSQEELGKELGLSRDQVRYAKQQAELRFLQLLRMEVRGQVESQDDVEAEVREILRLSAANS